MFSKSRIFNAMVVALSVAMVVYQVWYVFRPTISPVEAGNIHLGFGLTLVFLYALRRAAGWLEASLIVVFIVAGLAVTAYVGINYEALIDRMGASTKLDFYVGIVLIIVVLEGARRAFGWAIPIFALIILAYAYWGPHMPGLLMHGGFSVTRLVGNMTTYLTGVYGSVLATSTSLIAIFMIFGGILNACYASDFFVKLALRLTQGTRAGPALAAVSASALFGSISGSPVANATTTGIFTIPLMRRHGFSGSFAGATEAVASTGGTLMPPIMGVAAFLMASITGIPYIEIAAHALVPSIIYFAAVTIAVYIQARKANLKHSRIEIAAERRWTMILEAVTFFVPFGLIVFLMIARYPVTMAALVGTSALIFLVILREALYWLLPIPPPTLLGATQRNTSPNEVRARREGIIGQMLNGAADGAINAARIGVVCATLGMVIHAFTMTGMAGRLVHNMSALAGDNLLLTLFVVAAVSLLFGLGVPTVGSYVIVAVLAAPLLTILGVELLSAHMFVLYFTMMSGLTPPVGTTVVVTAQIAAANYWKTALKSITMAMPGFVVPFLYAYEPALLGFGNMTEIVWTSLSVIIGVFAFTACIENFTVARCSLLERVVLLFATAPLLLAGVIGFWAAVVGACIVALLLLMQQRRLRLQQANV
ncbi:MAG: hypothetical protein TEF_18910 [Rhizobiales bacterium NRL2]|jgi:TRAP transporter 4TM/12TM fusion protein|nr:MAG: hypothetical protein TEF_18910 [Rhizobiales bacterium NRL2]